jgi:hypothetical protein
MKAPTTQEEINYRESLANKVNAISSIQGLFTDIEDKPRRLRILKTLLTSLNYGDDINTEIDAEIDALEKLSEEEQAATEGEGTEMGGEAGGESAPPEADNDLGSLDTLESFNKGTGDILLEDSELDLFKNINILTEEDLPNPADLDSEIDFSENK